MSAEVSNADRDAAWVSFETRAQLPDVRRFCARVERVFRINPYLEIRSWREQEPEEYRVALRNLSNGRDQELVISASRPEPNALLLAYARGLKRSTCIEFETCDQGSRVRITDDYSGSSKHDRLARTGEVDRSLTAWGIALRAYLERERRFGRFALWHALLDRVWLPMSPSARRITFILLGIAAAEVVLTIVIALVIWLESGTVT